MDDPHRDDHRHRNELRHRTRSGRADDQQTVLAGVLVLDVSDRVLPRVENVVVGDAVLARRAAISTQSRLP